MVFRTAPQELTFEMLDTFIVAGGNILDSAEVYGSEPAIAGWLKARNNRESIVILTKSCIDLPEISPEGIPRGIDGNLSRLQTDFIDLYMLHRDDPSKPVEMIVDALNKEVERGRIRSFGGSNWKAARIQAANDYAEENGLMGFAGSSENFSLAIPNEERWAGVHTITPEEHVWRSKNQLPLFPWSSQAGGFFAQDFSPDDTSNPEMVRVYFNPTNFAKKARAAELANEKGCETIQIVLAYVLAQPFPISALAGPRDMKELRSCLDAEKIELTRAEVEWLELKRDAR